MSSLSRKRSSTAKERPVSVLLLDKSTLQLKIRHKTRYGDILIQIRKHLSLSSSNLFGLAYKTDDGDFDFVDPLSKVWKKEKCSHQSANNQTHTIYLRVQYYVGPSYQFRSDADKKHYYLQLKENFLSYGFNYPSERCFLLASYAIQSDEVNWRNLDPRQYFPAWVLKIHGRHFVRKHMPTIRPDKLTPAQAMNTYIDELSRPCPYTYNLRLYKLHASKSETTHTVRIGVCADGLQLYHTDNKGYLNLTDHFSWSQLQLLQAVKRRFVLTVHSRRLEFYASSDDWCRALVNMIIKAKNLYTGADGGPVFQRDDVELTVCPIFREAYIYSDEHDLELEYEQGLMGTLRSTCTIRGDSEFMSADDISLSDIYTPPTSNIPTRHSILSSTSSTTTSGIVSDRTCLSTEVSQEDLISSHTRPSSCDSLLESEYDTTSQTRLVTVQRTISEPSKNFDHLRFKARRSPKNPPRRALSDETIDEHDYENIAIIRKVLAAKPPARRKTGSETRSRKSTSKSADYLLPSHFKSQSSGTTAHVPHHVPSNSAPLPFHSRYSLISNSPSMEQLLLDYRPPPSYNETHARQGERLLAASRQVSEDSTSSNGAVMMSPPRTSTPVLSQQRPSVLRQRSESQKMKSNESAEARCKCTNLSHPEIDQLRIEVKKDMISLPMISALCNDKELQATRVQCTCSTQSPRPTSWHCNTPVFTFPPSSVNENINVAQVCR